MPVQLSTPAPHKVEVVPIDLKAPGEGQVLVKTEYASGKHGTATAMFDGVNFAGQRFDQEMRLFVPDDTAGSQSPRPMGTTGVGIVEEVGSGVTRWRPGDRVLGLMKVASENICAETDLWELGSIDPLQALCIEPAYVSIHSVRESQIRWGDTVAVVGLGAIGLIAVAMAYGAGANFVIAVDPLEKRRAWALEHGAVAAIDPLAENAPLRVHELTHGLGADGTIEASGRYEALEVAIKSTRMRGTVCSAGFYQGESHGLWLGREWHHNRLTMIVPHGCGWAHEPRDYPRWHGHRAYDVIVDMLRQKRLDLSGLIDPLVAIEEMPDVFRRIEQDPGTVIKYGVRFQDEV
jgi:threonine dehydrogenase-like Zn-dependent dehydrogenase